MKGFGDHQKPKKKQEPNRSNNTLKEEISTKAFEYHSKGNISEAAKYYQLFLDL